MLGGSTEGSEAPARWSCCGASASRPVPTAQPGARALLGIAEALGMGSIAGAGLLEIPSSANGRGLREAGVLPNAGPGLSEPALAGGRDAQAIAEGLATGELGALYLLQTDPLRDLPDRDLWERALSAAGTVVAHASFLTEGIAEHADVVFPAEAYAEKEGTIVHPDGRLQRLRPAIARPGEVRAGWQVIAELALLLGLDLDVMSGSMVSRRLFEAVPFYAGLRPRRSAAAACAGRSAAAAEAFPRAAAGSQAPATARPPPRRRRTPPTSPAIARSGMPRRSSSPRPPVPLPPPGAGVSVPAVVGYFEPWWIQVIKAIVIFAVALQLVPIVLIAERKLLGRFQGRYGPNRVGPYGLCSRWRTSSSCSPRSSSGPPPRSASCSPWLPSSRS